RAHSSETAAAPDPVGSLIRGLDGDRNHSAAFSAAVVCCCCSATDPNPNGLSCLGACARVVLNLGSRLALAENWSWHGSFAKSRSGRRAEERLLRDERGGRHPQSRAYRRTVHGLAAEDARRWRSVQSCEEPACPHR